jgi:hypothetical protein
MDVVLLDKGMVILVPDLHAIIGLIGLTKDVSCAALSSRIQQTSCLVLTKALSECLPYIGLIVEALLPLVNNNFS